MPSLWFVCPAAGRVELARICLRHLRHTCDQLTAHGVQASAVVVADDENLETAWDFGFHTVKRDNTFLSKKYNDGIELACNPKHNPRPVDYVVPIGSDDWVDWRLFIDLPPPDTVVGFQRLAIVREDGVEMISRQLSNVGGCGIRIFPREVMAQRWFRPADEDRRRMCDTSILTNLYQAIPDLKVIHPVIDPVQIVDWKSGDTQLTPFKRLRAFRQIGAGDPFEQLRNLYPHQLLAEMRNHYARVAVAA